MNKIKSISLRKKMIVAFCIPTVLLFLVNMMLYVGTSQMLDSLDEIYASNNSLNTLNDSLDRLQNATAGYLNTKTSDALEEYYICEQEYSDFVEQINDNHDNNDNRVLERNIKHMSKNYLKLTNQAVESKRGGNVEKYKSVYEEAESTYGYIGVTITTLNNRQFINNSKSYAAIEELNILTLIVIGLANLIFVVLIASTIAEPLIKLAASADAVSKGDFDAPLLPVRGNDEVGVVTNAFNKMVVSIKDYIRQLTESMEATRKLRENELIMENHIKDSKGGRFF